MCKVQHKIASIREEILEAIDEAFNTMTKKDYNSYVLFIGRADMIPGLKQQVGIDCVIDYHLDTIYDQTRARFYLFETHHKYSKNCRDHYTAALRLAVKEGKAEAYYTDDKKHKVSVLIDASCFVKFL